MIGRHSPFFLVARKKVDQKPGLNGGKIGMTAFLEISFSTSSIRMDFKFDSLGRGVSLIGPNSGISVKSIL